MKPVNLRGRLEIVFWIVTVAILKLLKDKKAIQYAPWLFLVCVCLAVATLVLSAAVSPVVNHISAWQSFPPRATATQPEPGNGQINTLVILVEHFKSKDDRLEGMWLVVHYPGRSQVVMLPLFPASLSSAPKQDKRLSSLFRLGPDGSPAPDFLQAVRSKDFWWDRLLILDKSSVGRLVELAGGVELDGEHMGGEQVAAWLPSAQEAPQAALAAQAALANELCRKSPQLLSGNGAIEKLESVLGLTFSTVDVENGNVSGLRMPEPASIFSCEIPTLRQVSMQEIVQLR